MPDIQEINLKQPNPRLVSQLRGLLKDAESGDIVGIAGAVYYHDGCTSEHWVRTPESYSADVVGDRLLGCLTRLQFMLMACRLGIDISADICENPDNDEPS